MKTQPTLTDLRNSLEQYQENLSEALHPTTREHWRKLCVATDNAIGNYSEEETEQ